MSNDERIQGVQELERLKTSSEQLELEVKRELGGVFSKDDDRLAVIQIVAVIVVGVVAFFGHPEEDNMVLESLLVTFAVLFGIELIVWTRLRGWDQTLSNNKHPELQAAWRLGALLNCIALAGAILLVADPGHSVMSDQNACTLAAFTVFLLVTSNRKFGEMTLAF